MSLRVTDLKRVILLVITGLLLLVVPSANFTLALANDTTNEHIIPVYYFTQCENRTVSIVVTAMQDSYPDEYTLHGCELVNASEQRWECFCENVLNVSLESFYSAPKTYVYSILSVAKGSEPLLTSERVPITEQATTDEQVITVVSSRETSLDNPSPSEIVVSVDKAKNLRADKITGAVIGTGDFPVRRWSLILFVVIALSLLINVRFVDMPWLPRNIRAKRLHKFAKQLFTEGEHTKAEKYYAKAAKLRK